VFLRQDHVAHNVVAFGTFTRFNARNLCASTIRKYRLLSRQMNELCCERKIQFLNQLDLATLSEFRCVHLFWSEKGDLETIVGSWRKRLAKLFRMAKIENGPHPHRFRDTFAAELLQAGVPLERVSIIAGAPKHKNNREILRCMDTGAATSG
jgi:integrase